MRLHHLQITAFGPFADTVAVDFERLGEAGLFLLTGDTGSGKTSILDAVCFALYGTVPGDRASAKRLRSDQAATFTEPLVELELSLAGRRFRVTRSPAWQRPKKRGDGVTSVPAKVSFSEWTSSEWKFLSSRIDEVGDLITALVGLTMTQFVQVALLPQGKFQTFLRARSDERHKLLQHLFGTVRFEQMEQWLRAQRLQASRESDAMNDRVAQLLGRVSEVAEVGVPADWDVGKLAAPVLDGEVEAWVSTLEADGATAAVSAKAVATQAQATFAEVDQRHQAALKLHDLQDEARSAQGKWAQADQLRSRMAQIAVVLEAAERATQVLPWLEAQQLSAAALHRTTQELGRCIDRVGACLHAQVTLSQLPPIETALKSREADLRTCVPLVQRRERLAEQLARCDQRIASLSQELEVLAVQEAALPAKADLANAELALAQQAMAQLPTLQLRAETLAVRGQAWRTIDLLAPKLGTAEARLFDAKARAQLAREEWLTVREERLNGMAAEMANQLAVGCACPVCGSAEHPHPARSSPGAIDATAEKAARTRVDDAEAHTQAHADTVHTLRLQLDKELQRAGVTRVEESDVAHAQQEAAEIALVAEALDARRHAAEAVATQSAEVQKAQATLRQVRQEVRDQRDNLKSEELEVSDSLSLRLPPDLDPELAADSCAELLEYVRQARQLAQEAERAQSTHNSAQEQVRAACELHGFCTPEDAQAALLAEGDRQGLRLERDTLEAELVAVKAVLDRVDITQALKQDRPDLDGLGEELRQARAAQEVARTRAEVTQRASARVTELVRSLAAETSRWIPALAELHELTELCSFVEGKSADNPLQMRLSAFVLAYRLRQVVDAANARLRRMSDRRYTLEHTARRGAGETRGGLSLAVRDDWTGDSRDPATLSGGETFVVALALALGLADVITAEAGGTDLDTLFVDEGFGSLDSATLDDVLDTLDSLREGGRVVGVVSHVPEIRDRISTHLELTKGRAGSTVALRLH